MNKKLEHYTVQYTNFISELYSKIRKDAFGIDIGQNGWLTSDEQDIFIEWLDLNPNSHLLDIACGSGGPTLRISEITGCKVTGVDIHQDGINAANLQAEKRELSDKAKFLVSDGSIDLPFSNASFDAIYCIDAINHLPERKSVLREWNRVLKSGGRLVFTDPITITGILSKEEIDIRTSIGYFLLTAEGVDEQYLLESGFDIINKLDTTTNMAKMAKEWFEVREKRSKELIEVEGEEAFSGQQEFFKVSSKLAENKQLSRFAFLAFKK